MITEVITKPVVKGKAKKPTETTGTYMSAEQRKNLQADIDGLANHQDKGFTIDDVTSLKHNIQIEHKFASPQD